MSDRKEIKTAIADIVSYWEGHVDECDLSVDFSEAHERCWRCGCKRKLQRCHIIPDSLEGEDIPSNFVLLCARCHLDNPNVSDPEIMWDWLKSYRTPFYDTFWYVQGMEEYKKLYGISLEEELKKREMADVSKQLDQAMKEAMKNASIHFGDPHFNVATIAGIFRMMLKEYDRSRGEAE